LFPSFKLFVEEHFEVMRDKYDARIHLGKLGYFHLDKYISSGHTPADLQKFQTFQGYPKRTLAPFQVCPVPNMTAVKNEVVIGVPGFWALDFSGAKVDDKTLSEFWHHSNPKARTFENYVSAVEAKIQLVYDRRQKNLSSKSVTIVAHSMGCVVIEVLARRGTLALGPLDKVVLLNPAYVTEPHPILGAAYYLPTLLKKWLPLQRALALPPVLFSGKPSPPFGFASDYYNFMSLNSIESCLGGINSEGRKASSVLCELGPRLFVWASVDDQVVDGAMSEHVAKEKYPNCKFARKRCGHEPWSIELITELAACINGL